VPYPLRDLTGTVIAVTGATSGIGAAAAAQLVERGANVVLGGRRQERLNEAVATLGADHVVGVQMDVRSARDNERFIQAAIDRFGRLDSVVANAGIGYYGATAEHTDDEITSTIETNFTGTVWLVRAAIPVMLKSADGGDVLIVSSVTGLRGWSEQAVYAGTKFAQVGFADSLDRELRHRGIRVTALCPGSTATEFALGTGRYPDDPRFANWLTADDVANAIVTILEQPRRVRTAVWSMWSMEQEA